MSNYQQLCWIHITIIAIIVCSVTGSNKNESYDHPPVIVGFHDSQVIYLNNLNEMNCSANGSQPMKYTWFLNDTEIKNNIVFEVKWNGTLLIKKGSVNHTGTYHCIASNEIGKARSRDIYAHAPVFERILVLKKDETPVLNYPFALNCSKDLVKFSRPWPPTFKWIYENLTPFIFDMYTFTVDDGGALVFSYFRDTDPKLVTCVAGDGISRETYKLQYRLNYSREIQGPQSGEQMKMNSSLFYKSTDQTVLEGKTVLLYCVFHNATDGNMKWSKDGEDIPGENSPTFEINNATSSDAGSYKCSKENSSHVIRVIVDASATIAKVWNTTNNRVRVGDTAEFSCYFAGRPRPNITWLIDGVPITSKFSNPAQYYESTDVSGSPYRSDLVLFNVSYNASVICNASNKYESQLSGSYVMASDVPETLEQLTTDLTTETTSDSEYGATSTQNQQTLHYDAVKEIRPGESTEVVKNLILAVALSVSASIIVTFVMVLVICFVLRRRNNDINTTTTTDAARTDVEVQDQRQSPSFIHHRQHECGLEGIPLASLQHEHEESGDPLTSPQHEHEEILLTSLHSSDS